MYSDIDLYVGLPGSGKTYNAQRFCDIVVDDIADLAQLPTIQELGVQRLGITDVNFCDPQILATAISVLRGVYPNRIIRIVYFENDVDKCRRNVLYRADGRNVDGTFRRFEKTYNPPMNALKVWSRHNEI